MVSELCRLSSAFKGQQHVETSTHYRESPWEELQLSPTPWQYVGEMIMCYFLNPFFCEDPKYALLSSHPRSVMGENCMV